MKLSKFRNLVASCATALSCMVLAGCPHGASPQEIAAELHTNLQSPSGEPHILAEYQPWFGRSGHIDVGYSSQDRGELARQIKQAQELGISAFVVNWYGPTHDYEDRSYGILQRVAADQDFQVALMYDERGEDAESSTNDTINDLTYAYDRYFGPHASVPVSSYMMINDRPVIFIFPKSGDTDWQRVRQVMSGWNRQPILIYKDYPKRSAASFDGFFAWVAPGAPGWTSNGANWGQTYLDHFYEVMTQQYPDKIAVGAAWPGFNDSRAAWTQNRHMDPRCGKTMLDTLRQFRKYYGNDHPLPFLMIDTWNDYEEGTAIESGIPACDGHDIPLHAIAANRGSGTAGSSQ